MRNVKWRAEINEAGKHARVFAAPIFGANLSEQPLCWYIYHCWFSNYQGKADSSDKLYCIRVLFNT